MRKVIWIFVGGLILVLWGTLLVWVFTDSNTTAVSITDSCQYPERPLKDGSCDNEDPCDPTRIKEDGGSCAEPEKEEQAIEPKETLNTNLGGK